MLPLPRRLGDKVLPFRARKEHQRQHRTPAQIAPFVIRKLGYSTGRRLMLTAARFDGHGAAELGFADFVADGVEALDEIEAGLRRQVLKCAPGAVADIKRLILDLPGLDRKAQVDAAARNFAGRLLGEEGREGVSSFLEKTCDDEADRNPARGQSRRNCAAGHAYGA